MASYPDEILKRLQETELEILDAIAGVCEREGLNWFLIGGSVLGAKRHGAFIPWDDDIDMGMLRADYDRFGASAYNAYDAYGASAGSSAYSGQSSGYYGSSRQNPFDSEDVFWQWFNGASDERRDFEHSYYHSSYTNKNRRKNYSRFDILVHLGLKVFQIFMGISLLKILWILIPFGPILCLGLIWNGFSGAVDSLRMLKNFSAGGK